MGKAVLISIRPEWVEKILAGEKTLEIRRTCPDLDTPFKCYIYCTKTGMKEYLKYEPPVVYPDWFGNVVAEFTCNRIERFDVPYPAYQKEMRKDILERSCVPYYDLHRYTYHRDLFAWDISDLRVYKKPLELHDFCSPELKNGWYRKPVERSPQSWRYVEELEENCGDRP